MKAVYLIIFLLGFKAANAHTPDLSSLMIYEQNGKTILILKSSLTAFEAEVNYRYGKGAYKTPEAFNQLVIKHFQEQCSVVVNGETIKFSNIQVQLGHETNLFAELENMPKSIHSFAVKNSSFKDMSNNLCELVITINGLPQKQYLLNNNNQQEVAFKTENNKWVLIKTVKAGSKNSTLLIGSVALVMVALLVFVVLQRKTQPLILKTSF